MAGAERVFEIMEAEPEVDDGKVTLERVKENPDGTLTEADYDTGAWAWKKPDGSLVPSCGGMCGSTMWCLATMTERSSSMTFPSLPSPGRRSPL